MKTCHGGEKNVRSCLMAKPKCLGNFKAQILISRTAVVSFKLSKQTSIKKKKAELLKLNIYFTDL